MTPKEQATAAAAEIQALPTWVENDSYRAQVDMRHRAAAKVYELVQEQAATVATLRAELAAAHAEATRAHEREAQLLEVMWRWAEFSLCSTTRQALRKACEAHPSHDKSWAAATPPATETA